MTTPKFESLTVGMALPALVKPPIERIQLVKYAGASGDFNRIHVEEGFAVSAGYKSVFAHGMLSMGFLGQCVTDWAGGPGPIQSLAVRFKAITWPDDVITVSGEIAALDAAARVATVKLTARNQAGEVTCEGSAAVRLP